MIKKGTKFYVSDNSGAKIVKCIDIVGNRRIANIGNFILVTLRKCSNNVKVKKRNLYLGLILNLKYWISRLEGTFLKFFSNCILIFNKKLKFLGNRVYGIISKELKVEGIKCKSHLKLFQKILSYSSLII